MKLTDAEEQFLSAQRHGRLATIARDGTPQVKPVGFSYDSQRGTIDIAGMNMAQSAKYKNVQANPHVAFVADDMPAPDAGADGVRFLEIRGTAETVTAPAGPGQPDETGHLAPEIIRIRPRRVVGYNIDPNCPGLYAREAGNEIALPEGRYPPPAAGSSGGSRGK